MAWRTYESSVDGRDPPETGVEQTHLGISLSIRLPGVHHQRTESPHNAFCTRENSVLPRERQEDSKAARALLQTALTVDLGIYPVDCARRRARM